MAYIKNESNGAGFETLVPQYQVFVNDIAWSDKPLSNYQGKKSYQSGGTLPRQMTFDVPANVIEQAGKDQKLLYDVIETFICNTLTRKFMHEVHGCQIWFLF